MEYVVILLFSCLERISSFSPSLTDLPSTLLIKGKPSLAAVSTGTCEVSPSVLLRPAKIKSKEIFCSFSIVCTAFASTLDVAAVSLPAIALSLIRNERSFGLLA